MSDPTVGILAQLRDVFDPSLEWVVILTCDPTHPAARQWMAFASHPVTGAEICVEAAFGRFHVQQEGAAASWGSTLRAAAHGWAGATMHHARRMAMAVQGVTHPNRIDEHGECVDEPPTADERIAALTRENARLREDAERIRRQAEDSHNAAQDLYQERARLLARVTELTHERDQLQTQAQALDAHRSLYDRMTQSHHDLGGGAKVTITIT